MGFETPDAALTALETAYKEGNLEAAVAAKDFVYEAREMLMSLRVGINNDLIKQTADVLELAFRKQIQTMGFPDFKSLTCKVVSTVSLRDDLVELVEECIAPNGDRTLQTLHVAKNSTGWHQVIMPKK